MRYSVERMLAMKKGAAVAARAHDRAGQHQGARQATRSQFTLKKPAAIFLAVVPEIHMVNSALGEEEREGRRLGRRRGWPSNDAGSGSYKLTRYDPAIGFIAKRFTGHFMPWGPKSFDEIEFRTVQGRQHPRARA